MIITSYDGSKEDGRSRFFQELLFLKAGCYLAFLKTMGKPSKTFRAPTDRLAPMCISERQR